VHRGKKISTSKAKAKKKDKNINGKIMAKLCQKNKTMTTFLFFIFLV
jgi:hypothetical protein